MMAEYSLIPLRALSARRDGWNVGRHGPVKTQILNADDIAASTVEADGCLGKFADGLEFFGCPLVMSLDPFAFFLLAFQGVIEQHCGSNAANAPGGFDEMPGCTVNTVGGAFCLRRLG